MSACRMFTSHLVLGAIIFTSNAAFGQETALPPAEEIVGRVNDRDVGESAVQTMEMTLIEKNGKARKREMKTFRKFYGTEKRAAVFFLAPANIKGTAMLTYDYAEPDKADDQWLYLPAMRKVRRIPSSERGDAFLGSDFTYQDMTSESRWALHESTWSTVGVEEVDGSPCYVVEGVLKNARLVEELGYAKVRLWIDRNLPILRQSEFWNKKNEAYKRIWLRDYREVSGILTPFAYEAKNLLTGHATLITVLNAEFNGQVPDDTFTLRRLEQGL